MSGQRTRPLVVLVIVWLAWLSSGCTGYIPGEWESRCTDTLLVPEGDQCYGYLDLDHSRFALFREEEHWLLATAWIGPEYQLIQSTIDVSRLRRSVRLEDGYCAGPICWIPLTDAELDYITQRHSFRTELTRIFPNEAGTGTRRGTTAFHAPTEKMAHAIESL